MGANPRADFQGDRRPTTLITLALIIVSFVFILFYINKLNLAEGETPSFAIPALLIGLAGILLGRVPSFAAGLPLTLQSSFDRFMISMMLGGSLFAIGFIELLIRNYRIKIAVLSALIALGIGQQFFNANIFRRDWAKQREIYWQLAWRVPALKPGTALLTHQLPIDYETDLPFTAPINWMYAPEYSRSNLSFALLYTEKRLGGAAIPSLEPDTEITLPVRRVSFHGSTSQVLVIYMPQNGCLRVLDPARGDEITYGQQSRFLVDAIPLSNLSNIIIDTNQIVKPPFLSEPERTWCYYFAKAELARQQGNWKQVIDLIDEAISLGYEPEDPFEWLTYIEGQARTGNVSVAQEISEDVLPQESKIRKGLCEVWKRIHTSTPQQQDVAQIEKTLSVFQCALRD